TDIPHTVTFGPAPAEDETPSGTDRPGHATISAVGQAAHSGYLGASFPNGTQFSVTFTAPGTYPYICVLHADLGMRGTIVVAGAAPPPTPAPAPPPRAPAPPPPPPVFPEWPPPWLFGSGLLALGWLAIKSRRRR